MSVVFAAFKGGPLDGKIALIQGEKFHIGMLLTLAEGIEYVLADSRVNQAVCDLVAEGKDPGSLGLGFRYKEATNGNASENSTNGESEKDVALSEVRPQD